MGVGGYRIPHVRAYVHHNSTGHVSATPDSIQGRALKLATWFRHALNICIKEQSRHELNMCIKEMD